LRNNNITVNKNNSRIRFLKTLIIINISTVQYIIEKEDTYLAFKRALVREQKGIF